MTPVIGRPRTQNRMPRATGWLRYSAYYASTGCTIKGRSAARPTGRTAGFRLATRRTVALVGGVPDGTVPTLHVAHDEPPGSRRVMALAYTARATATVALMVLRPSGDIYPNRFRPTLNPARPMPNRSSDEPGSGTPAL